MKIMVCTTCNGNRKVLDRGWFAGRDVECPHCNGTGIEPAAQPAKESSDGK